MITIPSRMHPFGKYDLSVKLIVTNKPTLKITRLENTLEKTILREVKGKCKNSLGWNTAVQMLVFTEGNGRKFIILQNTMLIFNI